MAMQLTVGSKVPRYFLDTGMSDGLVESETGGGPEPEKALKRENTGHDERAQG